MTEKDLDKIIDKAPAKKIRECLKEIVSLWFVENNIANFNKELNSDTFEAVTSCLHIHGFCPPETGE